MRVRILIALFAALLAFGAARERVPYVQGIEVEDGSFKGVSVDIKDARESRILAQGYDRWGIEGKRIYIEAAAANGTGERQNISIVFSARDVFGKVLDTCEKLWLFSPGELMEFECVLQVNDLRNLYNVTYKVTQKATNHEGSR